MTAHLHSREVDFTTDAAAVATLTTINDSSLFPIEMANDIMVG